MTRTKNITQSFGIFLVAVTFYGLFYSLNDALIQSFDELPGANLFRLSSGVKLVLVLLLGSAAIAASALAGPSARLCLIWPIRIRVLRIRMPDRAISPTSALIPNG